MQSLKLKQFNLQLMCESVNLTCLHLNTPWQSEKCLLFSPTILEWLKNLAIEKKHLFHPHQNKTSSANSPVVEGIVKIHSSIHQSCLLINLRSFQIPLMSTDRFLAELSRCSQRNNKNTRDLGLSNSKKNKRWHGIVCEKLTLSL